MQPVSRYPLKRYFQHSSLFVKNLPEDFEDDKIRRIFRSFQVLRINIISADEAGGGSWRRRVWGEMEGAKVAQVEFSSIAIAEKAFAVLNFRIIPDSNPPIVLALSPSRDQSPFNLSFSGYPRLVNPLPFHFTDIDLYTLIRRFGALASARVDDTLGGIVQFWNEDDACTAEIDIRSAFARTSKITLQAYDPRSIICVNLPPSVDELGLKTLFERFGLISSVWVTHNEKDSSGRGLVSFFSPDGASHAIHALHGTLLESKELVLRYYEPGTSFEHAAQSTTNDEVSQPKDQPIAIEGQGSLDDTRKSSKLTTASSSSFEEANKAKKDAELLGSERKRSELQEQENQRRFEEKAREEREEVERKVREEAEWKVREAKHKEREEAQRKIHEEAKQKEREEIARKAREEAQQKVREKAQQKAHEEAKQKEHEEVERKAREEAQQEAQEAKQKELEEVQQKEREEVERKEREGVERKREEAKQKEHEQAKQKEREEAKQKELEEAERKREEAKQKEREEDERKLEEAKQKEREDLERKECSQAEKEREKEKAPMKEEIRLKKWEEATQAEKERCRAKDDEMSSHLPWVDDCALRRVIRIGAEFQKHKFSEEQPLVFGNIPWPVLGNPTTLSLDDITSDNVKAFFAFVKATQSPLKHGTLLGSMNKLFLPDRWQTRKALETVMDADLRQSLKKAGSIVSEVTTSLSQVTKDEGSV